MQKSCEKKIAEQANHGHKAVMVSEVMAGLARGKEGIYVDATFGRGGHSRALLNYLAPRGVLLAIDRDHEAIATAQTFHDDRLIIRQGSFTRMAEWLTELGYVNKVKGILLDLGVSSPQLDNGARGFSYLHDGPLDMRMDQQQSLTAADWLNYASEKDISRVLFTYGEERFSRRIARAIIGERKDLPIQTTGRLAAIVSRAVPSWEQNRHPARRTFQALRIFINGELTELAKCLEQALHVLEIGGRLAVLTFHSLEEREVKEFISRARSLQLPSWLPLRDQELKRKVQLVTKVKSATDAEIALNPRARSAKLRIVERVQ